MKRQEKIEKKKRTKRRTVSFRQTWTKKPWRPNKKQKCNNNKYAYISIYIHISVISLSASSSRSGAVV